MRTQIGNALLIFAGLVLTSYLLTWSHWHPVTKTESEQPSSSDIVANRAPSYPPVSVAACEARVSAEDSEFPLPFTMRLSATDGTESPPPLRHDCMSYAGNLVRYIGHCQDGLVRLRYQGLADEPEECGLDHPIVVTPDRFDRLYKDAAVMRERDRVRQQAVDAEDLEQQQRDRLGLPP